MFVPSVCSTSFIAGLQLPAVAVALSLPLVSCGSFYILTFVSTDFVFYGCSRYIKDECVLLPHFRFHPCALSSLVVMEVVRVLFLPLL